MRRWCGHPDRSLPGRHPREAADRLPRDREVRPPTTSLSPRPRLLMYALLSLSFQPSPPADVWSCEDRLHHCRGGADCDRPLPLRPGLERLRLLLALPRTVSELSLPFSNPVARRLTLHFSLCRLYTISMMMNLNARGEDSNNRDHSSGNMFTDRNNSKAGGAGRGTQADIESRGANAQRGVNITKGPSLPLFPPFPARSTPPRPSQRVPVRP